jgi:D-3-phosphoglycerate dehydrogenase
VAEHAFALMWAAARQVPLQDANVRAGKWVSLPGPQLTGKTVGIIGLGGIGAEMARLCAGMGMKVVGWNRTPREVPGVTNVELDTLLATADVVSLHLLLGDETRGFLSKERLAKLKPGAILVNTSRGAIIDEPALVALLEKGTIRAGLDVFETEPLPGDHPLTRLPGVALTAHCAFRTPEASETLIRRALDIVNKVARG